MIIILLRSLTLALHPLRLSDLEDVSKLIRASPSSHRRCSPLPAYSASCVYPPCLTLCSLYCVGADMRGEQTERRLPLSHPYSIPRVLTSLVLAGGGGGTPRRHFCHIVAACRVPPRKNITSTEEALCNKALRGCKMCHL